MRDEDGKIYVAVLNIKPEVPQGRVWLVKWLGNYIDCNIFRKVDYELETVKVSFPRHCIGNPQSLQFRSWVSRYRPESNDQNLWMALGRVNANERTFPRMI